MTKHFCYGIFSVLQDRCKLVCVHEDIFQTLSASIHKTFAHRAKPIATLQVSWSLTQECGSVNAADHRYHQQISNTVEEGVADDKLQIDTGGLLAARQPCDEAPRNLISSKNVKGVCGSSIGEDSPATITNTTITNNNNHSGSRSSGSSVRDCSDSQHNRGVGAGPDVDCCGNNHDGSSWELRHHFPPDALIPRSLPNSIFPVTPVSARTTAAHKTPTQIPPTSSTASKNVPVTDSMASPPTTPTARKTTSGSGVRQTTSTRRRPHAGERARARHHTVSTGLRDLGLTWAGDPRKTTSQMRSAVVYPVPGRFSGIAQSPGATEAIGEGKSAMTRHGDGGSLESTMKTPQPRTLTDWGASRGAVDGKVVVGLTAEVIKSPGVALDRSGRVTVVDKVMKRTKDGRQGPQRGVWYSLCCLQHQRKPRYSYSSRRFYHSSWAAVPFDVEMPRRVSTYTHPFAPPLLSRNVLGSTCWRSMRFGRPTSRLSGRFGSISDGHAVPFRAPAKGTARVEVATRAKEEVMEALCF